MKLKSIYNILQIFGAISIVLGGFVVFQTLELFYKYIFTDILFFYMLSVNLLVVSFFAGLTAVIAGSLLLLKKPVSLTFYSMLGAELVFLPIVLCINELDSTYLFESIATVLIGLIILMIFNWSPVLQALSFEKNNKRRIMAVFFGLLLVVIPTIFLLIFPVYLR